MTQMNTNNKQKQFHYDIIKSTVKVGQSPLGRLQNGLHFVIFGMMRYNYL